MTILWDENRIRKLEMKVAELKEHQHFYYNNNFKYSCRNMVCDLYDKSFIVCLVKEDGNCTSYAHVKDINTIKHCGACGRNLFVDSDSFGLDKYTVGVE